MPLTPLHPLPRPGAPRLCGGMMASESRPGTRRGSEEASSPWHSGAPLGGHWGPSPSTLMGPQDSPHLCPGSRAASRAAVRTPRTGAQDSAAPPGAAPPRPLPAAPPGRAGPYSLTPGVTGCPGKPLHRLCEAPGRGARKETHGPHGHLETEGTWGRWHLPGPVLPECPAFWTFLQVRGPWPLCITPPTHACLCARTPGPWAAPPVDAATDSPGRRGAGRTEVQPPAPGGASGTAPPAPS